MDITLVAGDFMQSHEFEVFAAKLRERGHEVKVFLAKGKPPEFTEEELEQAVVGSDFVLLAVSNSFNETLRAGQRAIQNGVPFGIYAAGPLYYLGPNLEPLRRSCQLLFVFDKSEITPAQELFPNATIVPSGSPHRENYLFAELTRDEARARLGAADDKEKILVVSGDKNLTTNILMFGATIEAAGNVDPAFGRVRVVIALHPGDRNPISAYADLARYAPDNVSVTFIRRETRYEVPSDLDFRVLSTPHILPGADLVVNLSSEIGIQAACLRIPVICLFSSFGEIWNERENGVQRGQWEQERNRSAFVIRGLSTERLARSISAILLGGNPLRMAQEDAYPAPPEEGSAVKAVVNALENFQS